MAKTVIVCPSCGKKLETDRDNIGREGQCPACEKVFTVPDTQAGGGSTPGRWRGDLPPEYENLWVLSGVALIALVLVLMMGSTMADWVSPECPALGYLGWQKTLLVAVSGTCLAVVVLTALTRKSFAASVLLVSAWATLSAVWLAGMLRRMDTIEQAAREMWFGEGVQVRAALTFAPQAGLYAAAMGAVFLFGAAVYAWYQYRDVKTVRFFGLLLAICVVLGFSLGMYAFNNHVGPSLDELSGIMSDQQEAALDRPPPGGPFT
ncbi:MAG: hypothetical protein R6X33_19450 [Candidatus Brocadiia bacterium]